MSRQLLFAFGACLLATGCGGDPEGPLPASGLDTRTVAYNGVGPNPLAQVQTLPEAKLSVLERAPSRLEIRVEGVRAPIAIVGAIDVEDPSILAMPVRIGIRSRSRMLKQPVIENEVAVMATGQGGRLTYRGDLASPHVNGDFEILVELAPIAPEGAEPLEPIVVAKGVLHVAKPPEP